MKLLALLGVAAVQAKQIDIFGEVGLNEVCVNGTDTCPPNSGCVEPPVTDAPSARADTQV